MKKSLLLLTLATCLFAERAQNATTDFRSDRFLRRMSAITGQDLPLHYSFRPMSEGDIAAHLQAAIESGKLSANDLTTAVQLNEWYDGQKSLLYRENDRSSLKINLTLDGAVSLNNDKNVNGKGTLIPALSGSFGKLSFYSQMRVSTEIDSDSVWANASYQPYDGISYNLLAGERSDSASARASDIFRAGVSWQVNKLRFDFAVDHLQTGPARYNPLTLNCTAAPVTYLRATLPFGWFTYSQIISKLRSFKEADKYLHLHRIEFPLWKERLTFGFNESIVYGTVLDSAAMAKVHSDPLDSKYYNEERRIEPVYIIPFVPFAFAEHFTGDRDNALVSFDIEASLPHGIQLYAEFALDDISNPATLFSEDWGNKWALTTGAEWFTEIAGKSFNTGLEFTRVEPWVYTHFKGASARYSNYGSSLGAQLGPNSLQFNADAELWLNEKHGFRLSFQNSQWDRSYRGGDLNHIFVDERQEESYFDSETKEFLKTPEKQSTVGVEWNLLPYRLYEMTTRVELSSYTDAAGTKADPVVELGLWGAFNF